MSADFTLDWDRAARTGVAEAIICEHKSPEQIASIAQCGSEQGKRLLFTRMTGQMFDALPGEIQALLAHDPLSRTATLGSAQPRLDTGIGIVCAGTSDLPVAREALHTLDFFGHEAALVADVGVAGLWRLQERLPEIRRFRVVIAVAGMEGALFSVLAGLVRAPLIAVPTAIGYGVAAGGTAALHSALASCSPGVVVVNIDNGFGAAAAAIKMVSIS